MPSVASGIFLNQILNGKKYDFFKISNFLACVTPWVLKGSLKKFQPIRSSKAIFQAFSYKICIGTVDVFLCDFPLIWWHVRFTTFSFKPLSQANFRTRVIFNLLPENFNCIFFIMLIRLKRFAVLIY